MELSDLGINIPDTIPPVSQKLLHHRSEKLKQNAFKKACAFEIQRLVKKARRCRIQISEEGSDVPDHVSAKRKAELVKLESDLEVLTGKHGSLISYVNTLDSSPASSDRTCPRDRVMKRVRHSKTYVKAIENATSELKASLNKMAAAVDRRGKRKRDADAQENREVEMPDKKARVDDANTKHNQKRIQHRDHSLPREKTRKRSILNFNAQMDDDGRKNRPGQQARRKIWESVYGDRAKHLQTITKSNHGGQSARTDHRTNLRDGGRPQYDRNASTRCDSTQPSRADKPVPSSQPPKKEEGPLHPSWEAKRLMKLKAASAITTKPTKIVFPDD
ncbi:hypothetical protein SeLEV6574_g07400 [Synchytrium endobioticum]|uniref:Bud22 domain-containing protein n=1 Tax=Synchytrium endobioticum TaxID=286115 RepID=A0A507CLS0_9FUNG|nr:hypothetical protein SeLEV6574_g07400 [Synchytrium endobioticum]